MIKFISALKINTECSSHFPSLTCSSGSDLLDCCSGTAPSCTIFLSFFPPRKTFPANTSSSHLNLSVRTETSSNWLLPSLLLSPSPLYLIVCKFIFWLILIVIQLQCSRPYSKQGRRTPNYLEFWIQLDP